MPLVPCCKVAESQNFQSFAAWLTMKESCSQDMEKSTKLGVRVNLQIGQHRAADISIQIMGYVKANKRN